MGTAATWQPQTLFPHLIGVSLNVLVILDALGAFVLNRLIGLMH